MRKNVREIKLCEHCYDKYHKTDRCVFVKYFIKRAKTKVNKKQIFCRFRNTKKKRFKSSIKKLIKI